MSSRKKFARRLAAVLLAGSWTLDDLQKKLKSSLCPHHRRTPWLDALAGRILARFKGNRFPPTERQLTDFLRKDEPLWDKISKYNLEEKSAIDLLALPRPRMQPGPGISSAWNLPEIITPGELADWCHVSPSQIDWLADCHGRERTQDNPKLRNYYYRWLAKKSGGQRLIEEPKPRLKSIQRKILKEILNRIPPHESAHAFRPGRSVLTYVAPHVGKETVLHLDLRHFFSSIRRARIASIFRWTGYPEAVANLLAGLCANTVPHAVVDNNPRHADVGCKQQLSKILGNPHLPQGAPSSPALANLAAHRLDCRLSGLARKEGVSYSRYADDLVFSGNGRFGKGLSQFRIMVCAIVLNEGFEIRRRKTRVLNRGHRQEVAGLVLNERPNIRREEYDRLRAILHNCKEHGPAGENRAGHEHFREHLRGQIAHHTRVNPERGAKLMRLYEKIQW